MRPPGGASRAGGQPLFSSPSATSLHLSVLSSSVGVGSRCIPSSHRVSGATGQSPLTDVMSHAPCVKIAFYRIGRYVSFRLAGLASVVVVLQRRLTLTLSPLCMHTLATFGTATHPNFPRSLFLLRPPGRSMSVASLHVAWFLFSFLGLAPYALLVSFGSCCSWIVALSRPSCC